MTAIRHIWACWTKRASTGNETNGIPSDVPIFLPEETMSMYYSYSWIEKDWMESLSESYYSELGDGTELSKSKITEFFKDKCSISLIAD